MFSHSKQLTHVFVQWSQAMAAYSLMCLDRIEYFILFLFPLI